MKGALGLLVPSLLNLPTDEGVTDALSLMGWLKGFTIVSLSFVRTGQPMRKTHPPYRPFMRSELALRKEDMDSRYGLEDILCVNFCFLVLPSVTKSEESIFL